MEKFGYSMEKISYDTEDEFVMHLNRMGSSGLRVVHIWPHKAHFEAEAERKYSAVILVEKKYD